MITILVTGSRNLLDVGLVIEQLRRLRPDRVIVGDCPTGADRIARDWCKRTDVTVEVYRADWSREGRSAGPLRNAAMVRRAKELGATVLAFPRNGRGTADCIRKARAAGLTVVER